MSLFQEHYVPCHFFLFNFFMHLIPLLLEARQEESLRWKKIGLEHI